MSPHVQVVPVSVWEKIAEYLRPNIVDFTRLSLVSKSANQVFTSDKLWAWLNPYGVNQGIACAFFKRAAALDDFSKRELYNVWDPRRTHVPQVSSDELYIQLGLILAKGGFSDAIHIDPITNRQLVWCCVRFNPHTLIYASPEIRSDVEIVTVAVSELGLMLEYAPRLNDNKQVVLAAVKNDGEALKFASSRLQDDKEVVLVAMHSNGDGLQYASPALKADKQVVIASVSNDPDALIGAAPELWGDRDVVLAIVSNQGGFLQLYDAFKDDREVVEAAVSNNPHALQYTPLNADKNIVLVAIKYNPMAIEFASEELQNDPEVQAAASQQL